MHIRHLTPASARQATSHWTLFSWLLLLFTGGAYTGFAQSYQGPLVISRGGTYSGNWESNDSNTPAVSVETSEPVVIENANIRSRGILIRAHHPGINLTVRNSNGYGMTPSQDNVRYGRFLDANNFKNIRLEHNYLDHTSGIYLAFYQGNQSTNETVKILYNRVSNIDGRFRNGSGFERVQFVQFNSVRGVRGVEVAWNQVVNEPYKSRVEENINFYLSNGTSDSPMLIHNNYIQGAYPSSPGTETDYGGGGINMGDGHSSDINEAPGFTKAFDNHVVSTGTQGICVGAGHDMEFYNNRIINSGYLEDGTYIRCNNVGVYIMKSEEGIFYNNKAYNNVIGYVNRNNGRQRNDQYLPNANEPHNYSLNTELPFLITRDTEKAEYVIWETKLRNNGVVVGPTSGSSAPAPSPVPAPTPSPTPGNSDIVSGGTYKLTHKGTDKVLDVANSSSAAGANVIQWNDNGSDNQRFIFTLNSDGTYKITHKGTNKVLDVEGGSATAGANVIQWDDNGGDNQRWIVQRQGDGTYKLTHKGTNQVLDVFGRSSAAGAEVLQWDDNGGNNQRWVLTRIGTGVSANSVSSSATLSGTSSSASSKASTGVTIYPNPATDYVMLPTGTDYVQIISMTGKTVLEKRGTLGQRLDIQSLASGLYLVRVGEKGKISSQRLEVK
ncbi:Ricin B lectin [Hymenobacter roseosalivarius DSM 11622]|uniref:Ricin B lectin n=1 Tax=Hymenobacter roseosalivarius DSM 11622 TaxID=645990 RepID=A0A1W1W0G2_9BACT|nr:RICIN domain-containing protein [Hymenobacter roseosalivarius]SMB98841.1 Ricin B lectin [Hymenobacter roseosalivarius DSM 11622]